MAAAPQPRPRLGARRACLTACADGLVLSDGTALWHLPAPLEPTPSEPGSGAAPDPVWQPLPGSPEDGVVALAAGPDLNHRHDQLFAVTEVGTLHGWSWRRPTADGHAPPDAPTAWVAWPPEPLGRPVGALAGWSRRPGHQHLVLAADGVLLERRQQDWSAETGWEPVGRAPQAIALDAVPGPDDQTELYVVTAEGELKVKRQRREPDGALRWGGVETVAGWTEPVVALTSWTVAGGIQHQAVLLRDGAVEQRWRGSPDAAWSAWWTGPTLADDARLTAAPAALAGAAEPAGPAGQPGRQFLAALIGRDTVRLRRWTPDLGWQGWEVPFPAPDHATRPEAMPITPPTHATHTDTTPDHTTPDHTTSEAPTAGANLPVSPVVPATWWEQPGGSTAAPDSPDDPPAGSPREALTAPVEVRAAVPGDVASAVTTVIAPADSDPNPTTRSSVRAESATVLFTGQDLLPLAPGDPVTIGPFKLQRRVPGGQGGTDKFVARDGRGYCFLKVLRDDAGPDEVTAFRRESAIAQRVTDRHRLATYVDHREAPVDRDLVDRVLVDPTPGSPAGTTGDPEPAFLALSFVPGRHLGEVVGRRPLDRDDLLRLARSLLEALGELREAGIIHGDLKPANVIMRDEHYPVLVDFGSAVPATTTMITEAAFGTPGYAPPELTERRVIGPATDIYGWGAVLLKAGTSEEPADDPTRRRDQLSRIPDSLRDLVTAALSDEPANRPELDYARRDLARVVPESEDGLIRDRLPLDSAAQQRIPALIEDRSPARLTERAAALSLSHYRRALGIAALVGIVAGVILGTFLITWLRSL